jgi:hypothetical protein
VSFSRHRVGLLNTERRRRSIPLAAQGAIVMGIGLGIAYLMYQLTVAEDGPETVHVIRTSEDFP